MPNPIYVILDQADPGYRILWRTCAGKCYEKDKNCCNGYFLNGKRMRISPGNSNVINLYHTLFLKDEECIDN